MDPSKDYIVDIPSEEVYMNVERETESSIIKKKHLCSYCGNCFKSKSSLRKHIRIHDVGIYPCVKCPKTFHVKEHLRDHGRYSHSNLKFSCVECHKTFNKKNEFDTS